MYKNSLNSVPLLTPKCESIFLLTAVLKYLKVGACYLTLPYRIGIRYHRIFAMVRRTSEIVHTVSATCHASLGGVFLEFRMAGSGTYIYMFIHRDILSFLHDIFNKR